LKILLISPVFQLGKRTPDNLTIPCLSLHILAALTPAEHEVKIIEEEKRSLVDINEECDLVGISCYTANIRRCYELALSFKKRGIPVVLGGIHPSVLPEESIQYADAVVIGEAEKVWEGLLEDVENNTLKKMYKSDYPDLQEYLPLTTRRPKLSQVFGVIAAETSRGCPYNCEFCSVYLHYGRKQRFKPVEHVIRDLVETGAKKVFFADDNIMGSPAYTRELLKQLAPLKIRWAGQASIKNIHRNPDLLDLAVKSGCKLLFTGVESVSDSSINTLTKNIRNKQVIADTIKMIMDSGIMVYAGFIFGFDTDTESVFDDTLEFVLKHKISMGSYAHVTPFPGTTLFHRLQKEGRIISTNWDDYNLSWGRVTFHPKNFSAQTLYDETQRVRLEASKFSNALKRFSTNSHNPFYYLALSYAINREARLITKYTNEKIAKNITIPTTFNIEYI